MVLIKSEKNNYFNSKLFFSALYFVILLISNYFWAARYFLGISNRRDAALQCFYSRNK